VHRSSLSYAKVEMNGMEYEIMERNETEWESAK